MYPRYMTTNQNPPEDSIPVSPLAAQLLRANVQWAHELSDQVIEDKDAEIAEWKARFLRLYSELETINDTLDSFKIHCLLVGYGAAARAAAPDLDSH